MISLPQRVVLTIFVLLTAIFLIAPLVIVAIMSFSAGSTLSFPPTSYGTRWYSALAADRQWKNAALTSMRIGVTAAALAALFGTLAAIGLARARFRGKAIVHIVLLTPMIVPLIVTAVGVYLVVVRFPQLSSFWALSISHATLGVPFVIITVSASLQTVDPNLELAANSLGAGPIRTFGRITLPLIAPGVLIGALFAFIWSWDELVVAIFLSSPLVRTLPVLMWGQVRSRIEPTIAVVATLLMAFTVLMVLITALLRQLSRLRMSR